MRMGKNNQDREGGNDDMNLSGSRKGRSDWIELCKKRHSEPMAVRSSMRNSWQVCAPPLIWLIVMPLSFKFL